MEMRDSLQAALRFMGRCKYLCGDDGGDDGGGEDDSIIIGEEGNYEGGRVDERS